MQLAKKTLAPIDTHKIAVPQLNQFALPEKVLQFGTGVLLRGLPDYFIDKANKQQLFNGRIVVIKSTGNGGTNEFAKQDGLYTLVEKGMENREPVERISINASISRVLSANEQWDTILECAANEQMQIILSNTTEVGIALYEPDAHIVKPVSFPGRVLVFLEERYRIFNGAESAGMVIVPTELIVDNGIKLKNIITTLARLKGLSDSFMQWLDTANDFCNSLVDRIVPGKLPESEQLQMEEKLGYTDGLMIMAEPYRLWAIETNSARTRSILSFSSCDTGVIISPNIEKFRELKLRLLNATHTLSCGLAYLSGFVTVKEAMQDRNFVNYVSALMYHEIVPLVACNDITVEEANIFARQVIDRFANPSIEHLWLSISVQYTSKIQMRAVPLIEKHYASSKEVPELMAMGFAAYLLFMHVVKHADDQYMGEINNQLYRIQDEKAGILFEQWQTNGKEGVAVSCLQDISIFGKDLTVFPGFAETVQEYLLLLTGQGVQSTLNSILAKKSVA